MKRYILTLLFVLSAFAAKAMSYEEARRQAWFLTDKMAYELNLTPEQCDRAYQINLDYLMNVRTASDCNGYYWQYRDADLRCVLFDWQYNLYRTLNYFFRPVRWHQSAWYFPVFDHYRYGYYYFERPMVCITYRGGMWHRRGHDAPSPYIGLRPHRGSGMRDLYQNRNWFGSNHGGNRLPNRPGDRHPGHNDGFSFKNGKPIDNHRPPMQNGRNDGWRNDNRNNVPNPSRNDRPWQNERPSKEQGSSSRPIFNDPYTNYRQTGNSQPQTNRGGAQGVGRVTLPSTSRRNGNVMPAVQRSQNGSTNSSNSSLKRGNTRTFGGR